MKFISQYSSDGEQPLCRRKRADSSPAAGTNSVTSASSPDVKSPAAENSPPSPAAAGASFSNPTRSLPFPPCAPVNCVEASVSTLSSFDPGMSGFDIDFDAEVSRLESQWAVDGILMNAATFAVSVINDKNSKSVTGE